MKTIFLKTVGFICTCCMIQGFQTTAVSQTMYKVNASDSNIQYTGRIDNTNPDNIAFTYPGVSIKAKFQGTAIDAIVKENGSGNATTTNYFYVIIDGGTPVKLKLSRTQTVYELARDLSDGEHTVELFKLTESSVGKVEFQGFQLEIGKALVTPDPLPARKIEFIGNSMTCGYGNEVSLSTTDLNTISGFNSVNENNYKAWGAITARNLNAQYSCVAYSGRGLYMNNTGSTTGVMPSIYDRIFPDNATPVWSHTRYTPNVVMINLGTNDFATETLSNPKTVDRETFVNAYIAFINKLKGYYPDVTVICAVGVMMSDGYPAGKQHWTRIRQYAKAVRDHFNTNGDNKVHYFEMTPQNAPYGEDWHPSATTHATMATKLTQFIESLPLSPWGDSTALPPDVSSASYSDKPLMTVTSENISISSEKQISIVELLDLQGTTISAQKVQSKSVTIPVANLPKGTYLAKIIYAGEQSETVKFIK